MKLDAIIVLGCAIVGLLAHRLGIPWYMAAPASIAIGALGAWFNHVWITDQR
jgi:hypothetical protein